MRWLFFSLLSVLFPLVSHAEVLINELYYDHPGSDEGYEFVELVNADASAVALAGYSIEFHDGSSSVWVVLWRATSADTVGAGGLFVVGGDLVTPSADAIDDLGLQNGPDAVRLVRDGLVVDLVGYGPLDSDSYFEGSPAPDVESGWSLARRPDGEDTNDNGLDFDPASPSPGRLNTPRRDVALRAAAETPLCDARSGVGVEVFSFHLSNLGIDAVDPGEVAVRLEDSTGTGAVIAVDAPVTSLIGAGDSVRVEIGLDLALGEHWILATADHTGDERPQNGLVKMRRRVGFSPILVSEIMSDPRAGCPEYVELFNANAVSYDLAGHRIRDAAHPGELVTAVSVTIPPEGFIVLTGDAEGLLACFPGLSPGAVLQIDGAWPSLNQTGTGGIADSVIVLDRESIPVERVAYPPQPADERGRSLERVDLFPGGGPHTWVLSRGEKGGSPGARSPFSRPAPSTLARVAVSPNPFDPYRSEILVVSVSARGGSERVIVEVFDVSGRRVAEIGTTRVFPSTLVWDGTDSSGRTVMPGIYILACEFVSASMGSRSVEKVVVGCGRKEKPGS